MVKQIHFIFATQSSTIFVFCQYLPTYLHKIHAYVKKNGRLSEKYDKAQITLKSTRNRLSFGLHG